MIILASQSPRRRDLLSLITSQFDIRPANVDETPLFGESGEDLVRRLASLKARKIASVADQKDLVIGSDTIVSINGSTLQKPKNFEDFLHMIGLLSDATHQVYTGICVVLGSKCLNQVVRTDVTLRALSLKEQTDYWKTAEPLDKAGGYGIQGLAARFVTAIHGSYTNIVGLPLVELEELMNRAK